MTKETPGVDSSTLKKKEGKKNNKYSNVDWKGQAEKVVRFCNRKDFVVKFEKCSQGCSTICFWDNEIIIHNGLTDERIFYCLLHEVGHLLVHENHQHYSQNIGFVLNNFNEHSLTQKIAEVEEEYEAWRTGYKQAKKMRLKINRREYEKLKASYLSTYFEWAISKKIIRRIKKATDDVKKIAASKIKESDIDK